MTRMFEVNGRRVEELLESANIHMLKTYHDKEVHGNVQRMDVEIDAAGQQVNEVLDLLEDAEVREEDAEGDDSMTCPLLVRTPIITGWDKFSCPERPLALVTLSAWCNRNWTACPDYRRHQEQEEKEEAHEALQP